MLGLLKLFFCDFAGIQELLYMVMNTILEVAYKVLRLEQLHMGRQFEL